MFSFGATFGVWVTVIEGDFPVITDTSCHCLPVCGGKGDEYRWRQVDESYKNQESGGIFLERYKRYTVV